MLIDRRDDSYFGFGDSQAIPFPIQNWASYRPTDAPPIPAGQGLLIALVIVLGEIASVLILASCLVCPTPATPQARRPDQAPSFVFMRLRPAGFYQ